MIGLVDVLHGVMVTVSPNDCDAILSRKPVISIGPSHCQLVALVLWSASIDLVSELGRSEDIARDKEKTVSSSAW